MENKSLSERIVEFKHVTKFAARIVELEERLAEAETLAEVRRRLLEISNARAGWLSERLEAAERKLAEESKVKE